MTEAGLDCIAIQSLGHDTTLGWGAGRAQGVQAAGGHWALGGVPYFIETQAFYDYYDSPFCNHGQLELRTIKTNSGYHHIIIFPNENMLVHRDKARSLNMLKQTKTTKTN